MHLLNRIATTLSTANNTETAAIGQVLVQCHAELKLLTDFCRALAAKEVEYPVKDPKEPKEDD